MQIVDRRISTVVLDQQREAAKQVKADWRAGRTADAAEAIEMLGAALHKSIVLDLAYEEYCLMREAGHAVDPDSFVRRFPCVALSLRRQICIHEALSVRGVLGNPEDLPEWPTAGDVIAGFLLMEELGRGSFGRVFRANEISLRERQVVVKLAKHGLHEAQLLAQVPHAGVVPVYSVATDEEWGLTSLCMPFISRATLLDVIEIVHGGKARPADARQISDAARSVNCKDDFLVDHSTRGAVSPNGTFADAVALFGYLVTQALKTTHARGIYHRDLKPSNILVDQFGCPLLIDFNLSSEPLDDVPLGGTLPYMAPEQLRAFVDAVEGRETHHEIGATADVFSLGVCLFELLYGVHPFAPLPMDLTNIELAHYLLERQALGLRRVPSGEPFVDASLKRILARCLEFDSARRPQSADELAAQLQVSQSLGNRINRFVRIYPRLAKLTTWTVGASLVVGGAWYSTRPTDYERAKARADSALRNHEYFDALRHLNVVISNAPGDADSLILRGNAYLETAQTGRALSDFTQAHKLKPTSVLAPRIAWCNMELGYYSVAARWYRDILKDFPDASVIHNNLGYALAQDSAYSSAIVHYSRAIDLNPKLSTAYLNRADAVFQQSLRSGKPTPVAALDDFRRSQRGRLSSGETCLLGCRICSHLADPDNEAFLQYLRACVARGVPRSILMSDEFIQEMLAGPAAQTILAQAPEDGDVSRSIRVIPP